MLTKTYHQFMLHGPTGIPPMDIWHCRSLHLPRSSNAQRLIKRCQPAPMLMPLPLGRLLMPKWSQLLLTSLSISCISTVTKTTRPKLDTAQHRLIHSIRAIILPLSRERPPSWKSDLSNPLTASIRTDVESRRTYYDGLCKPELQLDLAFEDNAPLQVGLVTIQDPYFSPTYQHIPYEIDSWFQVPCIPSSVPNIPPSSSFVHSPNHHSPVSSTSSFTLSMPTSSHSIQGQPSGINDMFRPTEYQLALDNNRHSPHHEPCKTEAMKQSVHAFMSSHF